MADNAHRLIPAGFTPVPSLDAATAVTVVSEASRDSGSVGHFVSPDGSLPAELGLDWPTLRSQGFGAKAGQTFISPRQDAPDLVLIGSGTPEERTEAGLRDAVAAFVRAGHRLSTLALVAGIDSGYDVDASAFGSAVAEAAVLSRYRYTALKRSSDHVPLESFEIVTALETESVEDGVRAGVVLARAATIARDLANTPPGHLTATVFGDLAVALGPGFGLEVETADRAALIELGCGGLLGVNAGSVEEPRMIVLRYRPQPADGAAPAAHLALVGKGIMYDSGGISLKPSDPMHLLMKMDMGGAAAVFGAMTALRDLGCANAVTAYLMCTDNMPSGSATMLGDVLTIRGGTTVEVRNTDAEGRLVMSDALVLAKELEPDAIVDIATLTGAALMALGQSTAAAFGNNQQLVDKVLAAALATDEPAWQLPLEKKYRKQLDSDIADIANLAGKYAGSTTAALFLAEFVGDTPWAHLDIAGTMQVDADESWRSKGATGYGARLLARFALDYSTS
jgi:leucyl aminopeptidase